MADTLRIGEVASAVSVNIQTVRYYERRGLMPTPSRSRSGYRQYPPDTVHRLRFIRRAQELGFSLAEIQELLALRVRHGTACEAVVRKTRAKIELVSSKIVQLRRLKHTLDRLAAACDSRTPTEDCPVLRALEDSDDPE